MQRDPYGFGLVQIIANPDDVFIVRLDARHDLGADVV
jgi:hypothetical protein